MSSCCEIEALRRVWFIDRGMLSEARMQRLQDWHDAERHDEANTINRRCFCCCKECDPR